MENFQMWHTVLGMHRVGNDRYARELAKQGLSHANPSQHVHFAFTANESPPQPVNIHII